MLFTQMHLKTLPMRFPDGGIFLYKLPPATNITKRKEIEQNFWKTKSLIIDSAPHLDTYF